jgi:hypothetical protein
MDSLRLQIGTSRKLDDWNIVVTLCNPNPMTMAEQQVRTCAQSEGMRQ